MSHTDPPTAHNMSRFWRVYSIDGGVCNGARLLVEAASNGRAPSVRVTPLDMSFDVYNGDEWVCSLGLGGLFTATVANGTTKRLQSMNSVVVEHDGKSVELFRRGKHWGRVEEFRDGIVAACVAAADAYWADDEELQP